MDSQSSDIENDENFHHPKDHFNRKWFSEPEAAAPVLKVCLPDSLKPLVSPGNLTLEPVSFIDEKLRGTQSDLLWACRAKGKGDVLVYFYILWEHQSSIDHWMALRLFFYMSRIWEYWLSKVTSSKDP